MYLIKTWRLAARCRWLTACRGILGRIIRITVTVHSIVLVTGRLGSALARPQPACGQSLDAGEKAIVAEKRARSTVAALGDMVRVARNSDAGKTSHATSSPQRAKPSIECTVTVIRPWAPQSTYRAHQARRFFRVVGSFLSDSSKYSHASSSLENALFPVSRPRSL
jgi:hypothetical protein